MSKTLKMTFGYGDEQAEKRDYKFTVDDSLAAACKNKIIGINESLAGGTAGGLSSVFISDTSENLTKITYAELSSTTTEVIYRGGASSATDDTGD